MIKAIVFDFGNVICSLDNNIFLRRISAFTKKSARELDALIYQTSDVTRRYETGRITSDEFFAEVAELGELSLARNEFMAAFTNIFTPIPATLDLIPMLKSNYKLGLLSNTGQWDFEHAIKTFDHFALFDAVTLSFEVGSMKPDKRIFADMLKKLGSRPQECVFIDDSPENVAAAAEMAFNAVQYICPDQLTSALQKLNITVSKTSS